MKIGEFFLNAYTIDASHRVVLVSPTELAACDTVMQTLDLGAYPAATGYAWIRIDDERRFADARIQSAALV